MPLSFNPANLVTNSQSQNLWLPCNTGLLQIINGFSYYICVSNTGNASDGDVIVEWNTCGSGTWASPLDSGKQPFNISCCAVGTVIYILTLNFSNNDLIIYRFDTASKTFLADSSAGPTASDSSDGNVNITPFPDGKMLVVYKGTPSGANHTMNATVYDPIANTWSASVTVQAYNARQLDIFASTIQKSTSLGFMFWHYGQGDGTSADQTIYTRSVTEALVLGTSQIVTTLNTPLLNEQYTQIAIGTPTITNDPANPYIIFPYLDPAVTGPPAPGYVNLIAARAVPTTNPTFALETALTLTGSNLFQTFPDTSQFGLFDAAAADQGDGNAYLFYITDNGDQDGATSLATLGYVVSTAAGSWSGPTTIYTTPLSNELTSPFVALDQNGLIAVLVNQWNPVTWQGGGDQIAALNTYLFLQSNVPACPGGASGTIIGHLNLTY